MSRWLWWAPLLVLMMTGCAVQQAERRIIPVGDADYRVETSGPLRDTYPVPVHLPITKVLT